MEEGRERGNLLLFDTVATRGHNHVVHELGVRGELEEEGRLDRRGAEGLQLASRRVKGHSNSTLMHQMKHIVIVKNRGTY